MLGKMLRDKEIGKLIVPIIPDEARTFGLETLFRQCGIYAHAGQLYEPVDRDNLIYYKEAKDGQVLEEGITEAGSLSSFIAAGTAYSNHGVNTIPFFMYYSMFGFQRVGDLIWLAADSRAKGFLLGGTSGRTTLAGEGLQHQDGNSHILAMPVPTLQAYDPAYACELAVIVQDGIRRMYEDGEDIFYYITIMNANYPQPPLDPAMRDGIVKGMYVFRSAAAAVKKKAKLRTQLLGSGAILNEVLKAQKLLEAFGVAADVWSVTSYKRLHEDAWATERSNMLHPKAKKKQSYIEECLAKTEGPVVAATDYMRALPDLISRWTPRSFMSLGTDGFGRSDGRVALRRFFEVDAAHIALAALATLQWDGDIGTDTVEAAIKKLGIDPEKPNPLTV